MSKNSEEIIRFACVREPRNLSWLDKEERNKLKELERLLQKEKQDDLYYYRTQKYSALQQRISYK